MKLAHVFDLVAVDGGDDIAFFQNFFNCTSSGYLGNVDASECAQINVFAIAFFLLVDIGRNVVALDAENGALHSAELFEVVHNLVHD